MAASTSLLPLLTCLRGRLCSRSRRYLPTLPFFLYRKCLGGTIELMLHLRTRPGGASAAVAPDVSDIIPMTLRVVFTSGNIPLFALSFKVDRKRATDACSSVMP